jgi:prophage antirepressor-like protein/predicted transcriptional regulator
MPTTPTIATTTEFNGAAVRIIDRDGQRWLTAEDVGNCLGYDVANARQGIIKLFNRHIDEFTESDSTVAKLTTVDGKEREVRIFSLSGCVLLSMFANTARAKEFRAWAKQVLAAHTDNPLIANPDNLQDTLNRMAHSIDMLARGMNVTLLQQNTTAKYIGLLEANQRGHVRITRDMEREVLELYASGMSQRSIATLLRISPASVNLLVKGKYTFSPLAGTPSTPSEVTVAVIDRMVVEERERVLRLSQRNDQVKPRTYKHLSKTT